MKKSAFVLFIILLGLVIISACRTNETDSQTWIPVRDMDLLQAKQEAADDIVPAPGLGPAYRANVHQQGVDNPWPPVDISEIYLSGGENGADINYRSRIVTSAGETKNNIIKTTIPGRGVDSLKLYVGGIPQGFTLTDGMQWSGSVSRASVLVIEIAPYVDAGEYLLEIGLEINGKDYGTIPCTIKVWSNLASIGIQPSPGNCLGAGDELSGVILQDVEVKIGACDKDYSSPWFPSVKKGEPCILVTGHIRNVDKEKFYIGMSATGYDKAGEIVAGTLDADHIAGAIQLYLEYEETGDFTLHLNPSDDISSIRISAQNSPDFLP